MTSVVISTIT